MIDLIGCIKLPGVHNIFYGLINALVIGVTASSNSSIIVFNLSYFFLTNSYFI